MLSKNAMNNMKNRYVAVLKKCRLMNVFGSLAVATTLAVSGMAGLAMPSDALAADSYETIYVGYNEQDFYDSDTNTYIWESEGNITIDSDTGGRVTGVQGSSEDSNISLTLTSDHTIKLSNSTESDTYYGYANVYGMIAYGVENTIISAGEIDLIATSTDDNAIAYVNGMYVVGDDNKLSNSGTMTLSATATNTVAGSEAYARIDGMSAGGYTEGITNTLSNSSTMKLTAEATSTDDNASAYVNGMYVEGDDNELTNSGTMTITATAMALEGDTDIDPDSDPDIYVNAYVFGMEAYGETNKLTNEGTITITSTATAANNDDDGYYVDTYAYAYSYGMLASGESNTLTNSGSIDMDVNVNVNASASDEGNAEAYAEAYAGVNGMLAYGTTNTLTNSGSIDMDVNVNASASAEAYAYAEVNGMFAYGDSNSLTNTEEGSITVKVTSTVDATAEADDYDYAEAYATLYAAGMYAISYGGMVMSLEDGSEDGDGEDGETTSFVNTLENQGTIKVIVDASATAESTSGYTSSYAEILAFGMYAQGTSNLLTNGGTIQVEASGTNDWWYPTSGMYAEGASNVLINEEDGEIIIIAKDESEDAEVYTAGMYAYGNSWYSEDGTLENLLTNDGSIEITGTATGSGADSSIYADVWIWGMAGGSWDEEADETKKNELINNGSIDVSAYAYSTASGVEASPEAYAYAYGMSAWSEYNNNELTNDGTIDVYAYASAIASGADGYSWVDSSATGMYAWSYYGTNTMSNSGTITVATETYASASADGDAARAWGSAYGMYASNWMGDTILSNEGTIKVSTTVEVDDADDVFAGAEVYGMYAYGVNNELTNAGSIIADATATGSYAYAYAVGMGAGGDGSTSLSNSGSITVTAIGFSGASACASGMDAWGEEDSIVTNEENGIITVTATAADGYASAVGIYLWDDAIINNFGTINVSASATNGDAYAYQAYAGYGTAYVGTWTLELGETYGTDGTGYYVFGVSGDGTLNFGADESTGATFIITNESGDGKLYAVADMVNIESYDDYESWSYDEETGEWVGSGECTTYTGEVTGYIAEVQSQYDFVEWSIVDEDGNAYVFDGSETWEDQYITSEVSLTEDNSPTQAAATQTVSTVTGHMTNLGKIIAVQTPSATVASSASPSSVVPSSVPSGTNAVPSGPNSAPNTVPNEVHQEESLATSTMYADAGGSFSDAGTGTSYVAPQAPLWKAFLMPFYSYTSENGGDYSTNMMGLALGASRAVGDDMTLGFHASLSRAFSDSDYTESTATSYALGVHGLYNIDGALYIRGQLSGFYSESDMDMVSSTGGNALKADADMDTYGLYAQVAAGYDIVLAPQHRVTPEIALSYLYAHMEGFDSAYYYNTGVKGDSFSMESEDYDAVYADASVRWTGSYDLGSNQKGKHMGSLEPTVKVGIRQALTDPEVSSTMVFGNTPNPTHSDLNETAFTCEAGITWDMGDVDLSLTYTGEFGDVEYTHMGMFKVEWSF